MLFPDVTPTLQPLLQLSSTELSRWLKDRGFQPWYAKASNRRWVLFKRATTFEAMSDLPKQLRTQLAEHFTPLAATTAKSLQAADGTHKLLLKLHDGKTSSASDPGADRRTACISTQVGCGMGCVFCASGLKGVERNLTRRRDPRTTRPAAQPAAADERLTHIVVMGMGEPLANLDNLLAALGGRRPPRTAWASAPGTSRSRPSACRPRCAGSPTSASSTPGRVGMPYFLANILGRFPFPGCRPGFVGGNADGRNGSAIHAGKGNQFAVRVSHGDYRRLLHRQGFLHDQVDDFPGLGIVECLCGPHGRLL